eukprot:Partr_v1_DN24211_c1_g1_i1_m36608 putative NA
MAFRCVDPAKTDINIMINVQVKVFFIAYNLMSEEENRLKWDLVVDVGQMIHKMRGEERIITAMLALDYAKLLIENRFVRGLSGKDQKLFRTYLANIAQYVDGNAEAIQTAARDFFYMQHCKAGLDTEHFKIEFLKKISGVQTGSICDVFNGTASTRYFLKTHQHCPTPENIKSLHPPDTKELFIYKLLEFIGIGPKVHFIIPVHGTKRTVYIATEDAGLILLSRLSTETANTAALLKIDLISRILCLDDCSTNTSNCGQVGDQPMIVDFRIESRQGYFKADILERIMGGNSEYNFLNLMRDAVESTNEVKLQFAKEALDEWDLPDRMNQAESKTAAFVQEFGSVMTFEGDLQQYVKDIMKTVE